MSRESGTGERVFLTRRRIVRVLMMVISVLAVLVIAFFYAADVRSPFTNAEYLIVASGIAFYVWYTMTTGRPGQVRVDGEGLTFTKGKATRSFPWSGIERVAMSTLSGWPTAHVFLVEPLTYQRGDESFYTNLVEFDDQRHLVLTSYDWEVGDVREIYSLMKAVMVRRASE
jgi:hypothetical protein